MSRVDCLHRYRRGASLFELMAAMTAASVVMATSVALVHRSFSFESRSRQSLSDERTSLRLARQFRADAHAALAVRCEPDGQVSGAAAEAAAEAPAPGDVAPATTLLTMHGPGGSITYRQTGGTLLRLATSAAGDAHRDHYAFSRPVAWTAACQGRLVSLQGRSLEDQAASDRSPSSRLVVDVVAAGPGDTP